MKNRIGIFCLVTALLGCVYSEPLCGCVMPPAQLQESWTFVGWAKAQQAKPNDTPHVPYGTYVHFTRGQNAQNKWELAGKLAKNSLGGQYQTDNPAGATSAKPLQLQAAMTTRIAVTDEQATFELEFLESLNRTNRYELTGNTLWLYDAKDPNQEKMIFKR
jgi:heat shock protein HslJ